MGFKENLRSELQYSGMIVKELADRTGLKKKTLDSYLGTQNYSPSVESAVKIAEALGVTVEYLVTGNDITKYRSLSSLSKELQEIIVISEHLNDKDRHIILTLARLLRERHSK